jgi:hypothetical protein
VSERLPYHRTAAAVSLIKGLLHAASFRSRAVWIGFARSTTKQIVATVYGSRFVTVKM